MGQDDSSLILLHFSDKDFAMPCKSTFTNHAALVFSDADQEYQLQAKQLLAEYHYFLHLLFTIFDPYLISIDKTNAFIKTLSAMADIKDQPRDSYFAHNGWSSNYLDITIKGISKHSADQFKAFLSQNIDQDTSMQAFHENTSFTYCLKIEKLAVFLPTFETYFKENCPSQLIKKYQDLSREDERICGLLLRDRLMDLKKTLPAFSFSIFYDREYYLKRKLLTYLNKSIVTLKDPLKDKTMGLASLLDKFKEDTLIKELPAAQYTYLELANYFETKLLPTQENTNITAQECTSITNRRLDVA